MNRWQWNSYEILENDRKSLTNILIRLLDDHEIFKDFDQNYLQEIVDHRILILDFKDFDQNSGVQTYLVTSSIWIDTIVDFVSTEIEVWGRTHKWRYRSARWRYASA